MSLASDKEIGPYRILGKIGEGGMGAVYRAIDTRLERHVAVKVLPESMTSEPEKVARFQREARLLAAVNHPGIGAIYDLEDDQGTLCLILELVEGQTLEKLLESGPIPLDRARRIFAQAAEALETAHQSQILHRDLKPGNIMIGARDRVKLLDFGLAKELQGTLTGAAEFSTREGTLVGTAPYLAPEQIRAVSADVRTEIWSLGCCLYEAVTGRLAFPKDNLAATLNAILTNEPDWSLVPDQGSLLALLKDCLRKAPEDRPQSMAEVGERLVSTSGAEVVSLKQPSSSSLRQTSAHPRPEVKGSSPFRLGLTSAILGLVGIAVGVGFLLGQESAPSRALFSPSPTPLYLSVSLPPGISLAVEHPLPALRPDGRAVVVPVLTEKGRQLFFQPFDQAEGRLIVGSENGAFPFFSPQGDRLGFLGRKGLVWVSLEGGPVTRVVDDLRIDQFLGGTWTVDERIVFATTSGGISSVASGGGGKVQKLLTPDPKSGDSVLGWPRADEDGLYFSRRSGGTYASGRVERLELSTGQRSVVATQAYSGWPTDTGTFAVRDGALLQNDRVILPRIWCDVEKGAAGFSAAQGTLAYLEPEETGEGHVLWIDAQGETLSDELFDGVEPRLSPNGKVLCYRRFDDDVRALWFRELSTRLDRRVTHRGNTVSFAFAPEGTTMAVSSDQEGPFNIYVLDLDKPGRMTRITTSSRRQFVKCWTPSGIWFEQETEAGDHDLYVVKPGEEPRAVVSSPFDERHPYVSTDEKILAFVSNESGLEEVYLRGLPEGELRRVGPGRHPVFLQDGRLLFERDGALWVLKPDYSESPTRLLQLPHASPTDSRLWDAAPGGEKFLFVDVPTTSLRSSFLRVRLEVPDRF